MVTKEEQVWSKAIEILKHAPEGLRHTELVKRIEKELHYSTNVISTDVQKLNEKSTKGEITRPARGIFLYKSFKEEEKPEEKPKYEDKEKEFYEPFARYLIEELHECERAEKLGENKFGGKWGTPDVIGIEDSASDDSIKHDPVIVSAEIKYEKTTKKLLEAFGQTCAYQLFSHKTYLVIPNNARKEDLEKIESLCTILGVGLVTYNIKDKTTDSFKLKARAIRHEPDFWYLNRPERKEALKEIGLIR